MEFYKYHGTGNDFIMMDNRNLSFPKQNAKLIAKICHRRFGVGADGLILLENHSQLDFTMIYFNADGKEGSMCGNGGRCIVAFAKQLGIVNSVAKFEAVDGMHEATIENNVVSLKMQDVKKIEVLSENTFYVNTGSPHYVKIVDEMPCDFVVQAKKIRNSKPYEKDGINVNFIVQTSFDSCRIRTFERGVEDETYACGTGAVAAAIVLDRNLGNVAKSIVAVGGGLCVKAEKMGENYQSVWLEGDAIHSFKGNWV